MWVVHVPLHIPHRILRRRLMFESLLCLFPQQVMRGFLGVLLFVSRFSAAPHTASLIFWSASMFGFSISSCFVTASWHVFCSIGSFSFSRLYLLGFIQFVFLAWPSALCMLQRASWWSDPMLAPVKLLQLWICSPNLLSTKTCSQSWFWSVHLPIPMSTFGSVSSREIANHCIGLRIHLWHYDNVAGRRDDWR